MFLMLKKIKMNSQQGLYGTWNSPQRYVEAWMGASRRRDPCLCMAESLFTVHLKLAHRARHCTDIYMQYPMTLTCSFVIEMKFRDFPGSPVVNTSHFQCRVMQVWSLVGEMRSHILSKIKKWGKRGPQEKGPPDSEICMELGRKQGNCAASPNPQLSFKTQ